MPTRPDNIPEDVWSTLPQDILQQATQGLPSAGEPIPDDVYEAAGLRPPRTTLQSMEHGARMTAGSIYAGANAVAGLPGEIAQGLEMHGWLPQEWAHRVPQADQNPLVPWSLPRIAELNALDAQSQKQGLGRLFRGEAPEGELERAESAAITGTTGAVLSGGRTVPQALLGGLMGVGGYEAEKAGVNPLVGAITAGALGLTAHQAFLRAAPVSTIMNNLGRAGMNDIPIAAGGNALQSEALGWRESPAMSYISGGVRMPTKNGELAAIQENLHNDISTMSNGRQGLLATAGMPQLRSQSSTVGNLLQGLGQSNSPHLGALIDEMDGWMATGKLNRLRNAFNYNTTTGAWGIKPTLEEMMDFRTAVGRAATNQRWVDTLGQQRLNALYAAASDDIRNTLNSNFGPDGLHAFERYNQNSKLVYDFDNGPIKRVLGGIDKQGFPMTPPANAMRGLLSNAANQNYVQDLTDLRARFPDAMNEVASGFLASHARPEAMGEVSLPPWYKYPPQAQEALVPHPRTREILSSEIKPQVAGVPFLADAGRAWVASEAAMHVLNADPTALTSAVLPGAIGASLAFLAPRVLRAVVPRASMTAGELGRAVRSTSQGLVGSAAVQRNPLMREPSPEDTQQ